MSDAGLTYVDTPYLLCELMFWTKQARYLIREHLSGNFSQNPDGDYHFMEPDKTFDIPINRRGL